MGEIKKQSTNPGLDIEHLFRGGVEQQEEIEELKKKVNLTVDDITWNENVTVTSFVGVKTKDFVAFSAHITANAELTRGPAGDNILFKIPDCFTVNNTVCSMYEPTSPYNPIVTGFSVWSNFNGAGRLYGTIPKGKKFYINVMFPLT